MGGVRLGRGEGCDRMSAGRRDVYGAVGGCVGC